MNEASDLLKERSRSCLLNLRFQIERDLTREDITPLERTQTLELGRTQFAQINALLKATLDTADLSSFTAAEHDWAKMFDDLYVIEDVDIDDSEPSSGIARPEVRELVRYRQVLCLGLAMWAAHLYGKADRKLADDTSLQVLRILSRRFDTIETLLDVFERASEAGPKDNVPWTSWFLGELPSREAHFIPTRGELLFTTVLFATIHASSEATTLGPRHWLTWQFNDITVALDRLDSEDERWSRLIPTPPDKEITTTPYKQLQWWHDRVAAAREMFTQAKSATEADERAKARNAPLNLDRVNSFRNDLLSKTRDSRLIRDIFVLHGGIEPLQAPPEDHESLVSRSWLPKSSFIDDTRVTRLEMPTGDLSRDIIGEETKQLLDALHVESHRSSDREITVDIGDAVEDLRGTGFRPSLIVIPSGWALEQALGLRRHPKPTLTHPFIPILRSSNFAGVLHDVPVIAFPRAPRDRLRIVDLAAAVRYREWPSDENSGIQFEFKSFDTKAAETMLTEHPEVRAKDVDDQEAIRILEERVFISLKLCWDIRSDDVGGIVAIAIPPDLQR